jgi:glycosyltransferase involved in cell wall biosynthesis
LDASGADRRTVRSVRRQTAAMSDSRPLRCILITPARNEEAFIERTIRSMINQTVLPIRWVVVNDGSTDSTGAIVTRYAAVYDWINVINMPTHHDRSFAAKVLCFNAGYDSVRALDHDVVGNLDADVSFDKDYLEFLLGRLESDPRLGVAGTIFEEKGYSTGTDSFEGENHVPGGCQMFRRECFEDVGGYISNKAGGIDWIAVTTARMRGWRTRSFREKAFFHHRSLGTAERGRLRSLFSYGEKDYYLGGHGLWQLFRVAYRMSQRPYLVGGLAIGLGYVWAWARRVDRPVSHGLIRFHREEQMRRLGRILRSLVTFRPIDNFQNMAR